MSYRNSERKTQEMHATIALAVAVARVILRRLPFCDKEDEEGVKGSIDIFSLWWFLRATTTTSNKRVFLSRFFRMDFFQFISRHYKISREREREHT